ncbi:MAG: NADH-quinone oxidoreductase subunit N, partial [Methanobacteriota archaeon]
MILEDLYEGFADLPSPLSGLGDLHWLALTVFLVALAGLGVWLLAFFGARWHLVDPPVGRAAARTLAWGMDALLIVAAVLFAAIPDLAPLAPELVLVLGAALVTVAGFSLHSRNEVLHVAAVSLLLSTVLVVGSLYPTDWWALPSEAVAFGLFEVDAFSQAFKLIFLVVAIAVVVGSAPTVRLYGNAGEYAGLLLLGTVGMMAVASSVDLVTLFVAVETTSLATFALAGYRKKDPASSEAATKFFLIGALSSAIFLYGISILYGFAGTVTFDGLSAAMGEVVASNPRASFNALVIFGLVFVIGGLAFKITAIPFHMWAPDVYDGSPAPVSAFLAAGSKKMGFAALFKILLLGLVAIRADWQVMVAGLAILTMTVGNVIALVQRDVKRMLAYSSIAHAGYILMAIPIGTALGIAGGVFHAATHAVMTAGAFLVVGALASAGLGHDLSDFRGLHRRAPLLALGMAVFVISLAGLPPLAGFASKFVLFASAVEAGGWLFWLAVAALANSGLSLYYYARIVRAMYFEEGEGEGGRIHVPRSVGVVVAASLAAVILFGVYPDPLVE